MENAEQTYAFVKVKDQTDKIVVPISTAKPVIPDYIQEKWQKIVDLTADIMNVPTGLITRITTKELEIFIAAKTGGNPYKKGDKDSLGIGMFCETVAGKREQMLVQDTSDSEYWEHNPHAPLGMHSYLGVPIQWDDGELFGTFCMLNDKTNKFTEEFRKLILQFKEIIETDLDYVMVNDELMKKLTSQEVYIREAHHRIKNQFNLLISYINLHSKSGGGEIQGVLMDIQNKVRALSLIHEKLNRNAGCEDCLLSEYISQLCELIAGDFSDLRIMFDCDIADSVLPVEEYLPVGMIISELLSNSIKYAFKECRGPKITIRIKRISKNSLELFYRDNGPGYPQKFNPEECNSLGIYLVKMLTEQLGGDMAIDSLDGARYRCIIEN